MVCSVLERPTLTVEEEELRRLDQVRIGLRRQPKAHH
jgi:hypothetical protein